ncbi:hypothetical protein EDB85DRAFT_2032079, partial [Lactarius pseudohatsudake]
GRGEAMASWWLGFPRMGVIPQALAGREGDPCATAAGETAPGSPGRRMLKEQGKGEKNAPNRKKRRPKSHS